MPPCLLRDAVCVDTVGVAAGSEDLPGLLRTDVASPVHWAGRKRSIQDHRFGSVFCRGGLDKQVSRRTLITRVQNLFQPQQFSARLILQPTSNSQRPPTTQCCKLGQSIKLGASPSCTRTSFTFLPLSLSFLEPAEGGGWGGWPFAISAELSEQTAMDTWSETKRTDMCTRSTLSCSLSYGTAYLPHSERAGVGSEQVQLVLR